ncbi:MAG: superoxide dismutase, Ni [Pseudomonadota bacterium]
MYKLIEKLDSVIGLKQADAHCDIPCKIYDPFSAQLAALSVLRFLHLIDELEQSPNLSVGDMATLSRLVREKEIHAETAKTEVRIIWGDAFKQAQIDQHPQVSDLVHRIMQTASACKQKIDPLNGEKLVQEINEFAEIFWKTKDVETYVAECPYPPSVPVVYPKLG